MATAQGKTTLKGLKGGVPSQSATFLTQTQLDAPAGGTGATAGAYSTAANRNLMIASINAARADIAAIMAILRSVGLAR